MVACLDVALVAAVLAFGISIGGEGFSTGRADERV